MRCSIRLSKVLVVSRGCSNSANLLIISITVQDGSGDESGDEDGRPQEIERDEEEEEEAPESPVSRLPCAAIFVTPDRCTVG
jgi:hypothetical protein